MGTHKHKLTASEATELRAQRKKGKTYGQLAYRFKIHRMTAWRYVHSKSVTVS